MIAAAACPVPWEPDFAGANEVCKCRLNDPGWEGVYKNLGQCISIVNACNQADVPGVCECKYAQLADNYKGFAFSDCFINIGDCVSYLNEMGYQGGPLPACP